MSLQKIDTPNIENTHDRRIPKYLTIKIDEKKKADIELVKKDISQNIQPDRNNSYSSKNLQNGYNSEVKNGSSIDLNSISSPIKQTKNWKGLGIGFSRPKNKYINDKLSKREYPQSLSVSMNSSAVKELIPATILIKSHVNSVDNSLAIEDPNHDKINNLQDVSLSQKTSTTLHHQNPQKKVDLAFLKTAKRKWNILKGVLRPLLLKNNEQVRNIKNIDDIVNDIDSYIPSPDNMQNSIMDSTKKLNYEEEAFDLIRRVELFSQCAAIGSEKHIEIMAELINSDPKKYLFDHDHPNHLLNKRNSLGQTPLYIAAKNGNLAVVDLLIKNKANHLEASLVNQWENPRKTLAMCCSVPKLLSLYIDFEDLIQKAQWLKIIDGVTPRLSTIYQITVNILSKILTNAINQQKLKSSKIYQFHIVEIKIGKKILAARCISLLKEYTDNELMNIYFNIGDQKLARLYAFEEKIIFYLLNLIICLRFWYV